MYKFCYCFLNFILVLIIIFEIGCKYRKARVVLLKLHGEINTQNSFFSNQNSLKDNALIDSRDKVNKKLSKKDAIFLAAQGVKRN